MILDKFLEFSSAQAVTAAAASDSYVDLGAARDIGVGENLYVVVTVTTAFTDTGSDSTLTVALEGDSSTTFTPDGSQTLFIIPAVSAVGYQAIARIQPGFAGNYRYLQLKYTPNNGNLTTGSVSAHIVHDIAKYTSYANAITIS